MKSKWDTVLTVALVICAIVSTGFLVRHELLPPKPEESAATQKPVYFEQWRSFLKDAVRVGAADARVQIIEFADFECPFCASFHENYQAIYQRYPKDVALFFVHYPLPMHRFAEPAARASECAARQNRFEPMLKQLFNDQRSFGIKPWAEFAAQAQLPDPAAFDECMSQDATFPRIKAGADLAKRLNITGTPTVMVNGWKVPPPTVEQLDQMVRDVIAGKKYFASVLSLR